MRRNRTATAGPLRGIRNASAMAHRIDARNDTTQAHLLDQEKAQHPEGDIPQAEIGRGTTSTKTQQTIGSGATVEIPGPENESGGSVTGGSTAADTDTTTETKEDI